MKTVVIIPARMASKRIPGKLLKIIKGQSVIRRCYYESLISTIHMNHIYVASSDPEILWEICSAGGNSIETSNKPINGTERIAEAARILQLEPDDIVVNLQGDMPYFDAEIIDKPATKLKSIPKCNVVSAMTMLQDKDRNNPNRAKVNIDKQEKAISFSREYQKGAFLHIGVYVFRNSFLQKYDKYGQIQKEIGTHLEQQRIMHMKEPIYMAYIDNRPIVIDTEEDLRENR